MAASQRSQARSAQLRYLVAALASVILLTGCSATSTSKTTQSSFVEGNGVATYLKPAERILAPAVQGATLQNGVVKLSYTGITVLNVWASWCSPCRAEAPLLSDFAQRYKSQGVQFAGILTRDNPSAALEFAKRFKLNYPVFTDDSVLASFRNSLVPNAIPTTLIIDSHGYVAARVSGEVTVALLNDLIARTLKDGPHA
jgi:thiol-disulfide isomerase/thioredoxin